MRLTAWRLLAIASLVSSAAAAATRPHYGGTLRVQLRSRIESLEQEDLAALVFDRLVGLNESGGLQPGLATSWRHDPEFRRWEFDLRQGVKFHDGSALTAAIAAAAVQDASTRGETLLISSAEPAPKLLAQLASRPIWKRGPDGALIGSGPFRVVKWEPGRRAAFAANDDYWGGRPYLDGIDIEMGRAARDQALDFDMNKADIVELGIG